MGNNTGKINSDKTREDDGKMIPSDTAETHEATDRFKEQRYNEEIPVEKYVIPLENVVFEGGGNKGLAYCGAVRVLEETGLWRQVRRLAGASAGAIAAALLAVGYTSHDLEAFLGQDLSKIFVDHGCGCCSLLPNVMKRYGWNPGNRLYKWFAAKLEEATGNGNITFMELYIKYNKELCVVVTNVNQMDTEYCHPKTSPDMPVSLAVRMSMAIPGMYQAVKYKRSTYTDHYVDGGVLCNYPIHCFDGWYLSMRPEDSFLRRLHPLSELPKLYEKKERFGTYNPKTLGFLLYSETEPDIFQTLIEQREGKQLPEKAPNTKLAKKRCPKISDRNEAAIVHDALACAVDRLLKILEVKDLDGNHTISKSELESALLQDNNMFTHDDMQMLFGAEANVDTVFTLLDKNENQQISYGELVKYLEEKGINLHARFLGYRRREVSNLGQFAQCLQDALLLHTKLSMIQQKDVDRTVGINTYYLGTMDFNMEQADKDILVEQGKCATRSYLLWFIRSRNPALKTDVLQSYSRDDINYFVDDETPSEIIDERDYNDTFKERYN